VLGRNQLIVGFGNTPEASYRDLEMKYKDFLARHPHSNFTVSSFWFDEHRVRWFRKQFTAILQVAEVMP
jgi:hypothetical protein